MMPRRFATLVLASCLLVCSSNGPEAQAPGGQRVAEGGRCGGIAGLACEDGLWCDPDPGHCGGADIQGVCTRVPRICTRDYRPVCGCDGKTYGNDCTRRSAEAPKHRDGECGGADRRLP